MANLLFESPNVGVVFKVSQQLSK